MSDPSEYVKHDGYLLVRITGTINREWVRQVPEFLDKRYRACRDAGVDGMVLDIRAAAMALDIGDRYDLGVMYAQSELASIRVSILGTAAHTTPERFFQTVARNRGAMVRVFTDEAQAIAWARDGAPPDSPLHA